MGSGPRRPRMVNGGLAFRSLPSLIAQKGGDPPPRGRRGGPRRGGAGGVSGPGPAAGPVCGCGLRRNWGPNARAGRWPGRSLPGLRRPVPPRALRLRSPHLRRGRRRCGRCRARSGTAGRWREALLKRLVQALVGMGPGDGLVSLVGGGFPVGHRVLLFGGAPLICRCMPGGTTRETPIWCPIEMRFR